MVGTPADQHADLVRLQHADRPSGIVSAPLWDSKISTFAGLLTTSDFINVVQYYNQTPAAIGQIDQFRLDSLRGKSLSTAVNGPSRR